MNLQDELTAIATDQRRLATRVEHLLRRLADDAQPVFDPEHDEPPVRPLVDGDPTQRDWCSLMLWARSFAINVREGRGLTREEVVQIAKDAGYADGRGWNKWYGWKPLDDGRWVTKGGLTHIEHYYGKVGRALPSDLAAATKDWAVD